MSTPSPVQRVIKKLTRVIESTDNVDALAILSERVLQLSGVQTKAAKPKQAKAANDPASGPVDSALLGV